jgi:hypothetical protein
MSLFVELALWSFSCAPSLISCAGQRLEHVTTEHIELIDDKGSSM